MYDRRIDYAINNFINNEFFLDKSNRYILKEKSKKIKQWKNIEEETKKVLKKLDYPIKTYKIFYGKLNDEKLLDDISLYIKKELEK